MKKVLIALALAAVIPFAAYAAMDGHGSRNPGKRLDRMAETLTLDDAQKARMKALFEENKAERQALREQMRAQISEILNDDQRVKMGEMRVQRREHRKAARAGRHKKNCGASSKAS
jgi:Spy/CpxP family protein refolding chaperone